MTGFNDPFRSLDVTSALASGITLIQTNLLFAERNIRVFAGYPHLKPF